MTEAATTILYCACGATRAVPTDISSVISCALCGRRMGAPLPPNYRRPKLLLLFVAASLAELCCAASLIVAITWLVRSRDIGALPIGWGSASLVGLVAGAAAYRGGPRALVVAGVVAAALAVICAVYSEVVVELLVDVHVVPEIIADGTITAYAVAAACALASVLCASALPQARSFESWQVLQREREYRLRNGV